VGDASGIAVLIAYGGLNMTISELLLIVTFRQLTIAQQTAIIDQLRILRSVLTEVQQPLHGGLKVA
jgi:hypothetical protein